MKKIPVFASKEIIIQALKDGDRLDAVLAIKEAWRTGRPPAPEYNNLLEALPEVYHGDELIELLNAASSL